MGNHSRKLAGLQRWSAIGTLRVNSCDTDGARDLFPSCIAEPVDLEELNHLQDKCDLVAAEELFRRAFWQDVRPLVSEWRAARNLPVDPLAALYSGGYVERITKERAGKQSTGGSYA